MKFRFWPKNWLDGVEWFSTITGLLAATFIACNLGFVWAGYLVFLVSSIALVYVAWKLRRYGLLVMGIGYTIINLIGIWRWLLPLL